VTPASATARRNNGRAPAAAPAPVIPFTAAAHEHVESAFDVSQALGAAAVQLGPFDVPAFGYLRHIVLIATASGGTLGAGVLAADHPFNVIQSVSLNDVNGAPIVGPIDGFGLLQANIFGGYGGARPDPRLLSTYSNTINGGFMLRLPVEIERGTALGALANQNAAAAYKINITLNPSTVAYSTAPTTPATWRIRGYLEAWTLPNAVDVAGRAQAQLPPAHGTTQYLSQFIRSVAAGSNTVLLPRVGNLIRALIFVARTTAAGTPRDDTVFPDPVSVNWDARGLYINEPQTYVINRMLEQLAQATNQAGTANSRDTGVFCFNYANSDHGIAGDDEPTFWLPTVQSSRLELAGSSVTAGNIQVITCDVAPVEVTPAERFVETSESGFHPAIGVANPAAQ
jgi:hypothetical protein